MKAIRIFNAQPVKKPYFNSPLSRKQAQWPHFLLHFLDVHIMNVNQAKLKKSLIAEQFQGKYLKF